MKKRLLFFVFLMAIISIVLVSCDKLDKITGNSIAAVKEQIPSETGPEPKVYFCIKDNCEQKLIPYIKNAKDYVYCAFFDLDLKNLTNLLVEKSRDIDVKLVIDNDNKKDVQNKGILDIARFDDDKQLSHNKFCVIDDNFIWTGSFNPTEKDNSKNDNNAVAIKTILLAENYKAEFDELWNGEFGEGDRVKYSKIYHNSILIENYFCPDDSCEEQVINLISNAKKSVYFMTFSFTSEPITDSILFKDKSIDIKGIFDKTQAGSKYSQYHRFKGFGLNVKLDKNKYFLHHKVFIIDNETVITGSYNPTGAGNNKNDENILIIHDKKIAEKYLEEFKGLFG